MFELFSSVLSFIQSSSFVSVQDQFCQDIEQWYIKYFGTLISCNTCVGMSQQAYEEASTIYQQACKLYQDFCLNDKYEDEEDYDDIIILSSHGAKQRMYYVSKREMQEKADFIELVKDQCQTT